MDGWRYYNHAMIPTCAPHEEPDLSVIESGEIWKNERKPLLARWTSNFDCGYETNWWYVIKDTPFNEQDISSKERKSIRQALNKCYVKIVDNVEYAEDLYRVYFSAFKKYKNADNKIDKQQFLLSCQNSRDIAYWAGFDKETNTLIGYITVLDCGDYVEIQTAKFDPNFAKKTSIRCLVFSCFNTLSK